LLLSIGRRIPQSDKFVRNGDWVNEPFAMTHKVTGTRLGVVGLGRIGQAIAKRAAAFDMSIAYTGRRAKTNAPFRFYPTAQELASNSDYLVVAVPGGADTQNMINASVLKALGSKGFVINIARGSVIDQTALIQALKDKSIAGAGLDVFWDEPKIDPQLFKLHNVVMTPHIGSNTHETRRAMADLALANLKAFFDAQPLLTLIPECQ
jgi:lactate dehydrogenase-like 2-hydroxyacid dehydrogenase